MNCTHFQQILADYIASELPPALHSEAQHHAAECRACADELAGLQSAAAVFDSGRISPAQAAQHADSMALPTAPRLPSPLPARQLSVPIWMRYAAVIALAFTCGSVLRGSGPAQSPPQPDIVANPTPPHSGVIERFNSITRERPDVPAFSRSLLAVAARSPSK